MKQPLSRRLAPGTYEYFINEEVHFRGPVYKFETRNPKWFDRLTTLSKAEGQYPMTEIQMFKTIELQN